MQLFSILSIVLGKFDIYIQKKRNAMIMFDLVVLAVHSTNGAPVNSDVSDEINLPINEQSKLIDDESRFIKRKLPVEGILIGRRALPHEGILIGKREYPTEGILLGKRYFPTEGILLGKRYFPTEGILLGKRNSRPLAPNSMGYNN
jgi:hypothetical protein